MLGLLFNYVWRIIKLYFFTLGVLTFFQAPIGWLYATACTLGSIRGVLIVWFVDSSTLADPIPY